MFIRSPDKWMNHFYAQVSMIMGSFSMCMQQTSGIFLGHIWGRILALFQFKIKPYLPKNAMRVQTDCLKRLINPWTLMFNENHISSRALCNCFTHIVSQSHLVFLISQPKYMLCVLKRTISMSLNGWVRKCWLKNFLNNSHLDLWHIKSIGL